MPLVSTDDGNRLSAPNVSGGRRDEGRNLLLIEVVGLFNYTLSSASGEAFSVAWQKVITQMLDALIDQQKAS